MEGRKKTGVDNGGVCVVLLPCRRYNSPQHYVRRTEVGVSDGVSNFPVKVPYQL